MVAWLAKQGVDISVVTTPPYYPDWSVQPPYRAWKYQLEREPISAASSSSPNGKSGTCVSVSDVAVGPGDSDHPGNDHPGNDHKKPTDDRLLPKHVSVVRCPLWVPRRVSGLKRIVHLASFGLSSVPAVLWMAVRHRPDVIMTVEPSAFCLPTTWLAARLCGAKCWLHVQDFEVDAAFDLGLLRSPLARRLVLAMESFWMRRFDRVSSISPNMMLRLFQKGVDENRLRPFPNWVHCDVMRPLDDDVGFCRKSVREEFGISPEHFVALYAGNMGAKQGLETLTQAAEILATTQGSTQCTTPGDDDQRTAEPSVKKTVQWVICGNGATRDELVAAAEKLPNVVVLPVQPMERFNALMNCADVHLLPQRADAADLVMPSKLTGMLATGRPVVAGAAAGTQIADVVDSHGIVVPPGDAVSMASAVQSLAADRHRCQQLGRAAREYALHHLSQDSILRDLLAEFESLTQKNDASR